MTYKKNVLISIVLAIIFGPAGLFYCCTAAAVYICCITLFTASLICIAEAANILPGMFFITGLKILLPISYAASVTCSITSTLIRNKNYDELGKPGKTPGMTVHEERNTLRQKKILFKMKEKGVITRYEYEKGIKKIPD